MSYNDDLASDRTDAMQAHVESTTYGQRGRGCNPVAMGAMIGMFVGVLAGAQSGILSIVITGTIGTVFGILIVWIPLRILGLLVRVVKSILRR